ncbi:MAG: TolC family protein [Planctomycetota bacterium]|nr:TolC family protein [Planctomycetota bacterium]
MKRTFHKWFIGLQIGSVMLAGCHPTQPHYLRDRAHFAEYLQHAQQIEIPDLEIDPAPEATDALEPLTLDNQKYEFLDLTLEECVSYALVNSKLIRTIPGTQRQNVDIAANILSTPSQQQSSVYDPAIAATTTSPQQIAVDQNGNRVLPRGASRANQVGGVEDALSEFDAQFSAFFSYNNTDRARNVGENNPFNPTPFRGRDSTGQMALSKRMATGGVVSARSQSIYSYNNIETSGPGRAVPSDYTQILEFQVQHPLLRGRGTSVNRIPVVLARINEDLSLVDFEERVRNLVRDVEFAYWDLYQSYWNVENARIARDSAAKAYHIAYEKLQKGAAGTTEAQAKYTYHDFQAQLDAALAGGAALGGDPGLFGREQTLRILMGWASSDGRLVRPSDKPAIGMAQFDFDGSINEMLSRSVDLRRQRWIIKQRELELLSAKNQMLANVDLSFIYRYVGVGSSLLDQGGNGPFPPEPRTNPSPSAWEELLGGDFQEAAVRLDFLPNPIGARRASNDVRNKQLTLARDHALLEEKEIAATHRISQVLRELNSNYIQMTEQLAALSAADRWVKLYQEKFNAGESGAEQIMDLLLRAQQSRANAGRNYARALSEYNKSIVEVHMLKGSLLEYNNISLEEGLWPEKAYWDSSERTRERSAARTLANGASRPTLSSRGELPQNLGTANQAATARSTTTTTTTPTPSEVNPTKEPANRAPLEPSEAIPLKKASGRKLQAPPAPKFDWGA